jgi:GAF domain-containing protein
MTMQHPGLEEGLPQGHVQIRRHMNIPVFDGDRIVAVAGVGNKDGDYNESDVRQLTLLMQGMWRLIQRKRTGSAPRQTRFRVLAETTPTIILIMQRESRVCQFSARMLRDTRRMIPEYEPGRIRGCDLRRYHER